MTKQISILLLCLYLTACTDTHEAGTKIDPVQPNDKISLALDHIFSNDNMCLVNFNEASYHIISNSEELSGLDSCNAVPEIDFINYTLVAGKIGVSSVSDKIEYISLTAYQNEQYYNIDIQIEKCEECYPAIGYCYYWVIYPKLNPIYSIRLSITER